MSGDDDALRQAQGAGGEKAQGPGGEKAPGAGGEEAQGAGGEKAQRAGAEKARSRSTVIPAKAGISEQDPLVRARDAGEDGVQGTPPRPAVRWLRRARKSRTLLAGAAILVAMVAIAVLAPVIAPYDPSAQDLGNGLAAPSAAHWFGTDQLGRDILSRVIAATATDLRIAGLAAVTPFILGVAIGLVSGYAGGWLDWLVGRVVDTFVAFPFYVLVIVVVFAAGTGERGIFVAYALVGWISYARVIRAKSRALCREGWVDAAYRGGLSHGRVLARHLLPNVLPQAVVLLATEILLIMVAVVTLGYLGIGVQPPTPDWGTMISDGQLVLTTKWWVSTLPGLAVVTTGVGLSLVGDGLADVWRLR